MKKFRGFLVICLCILAVCLGGCASKEEKNALKQEFLEWMFTADYDNRFDEVMAHEDLSTATQKVDEVYYDGMKDKMTDKLYKKLVKNRMPWSFDEKATGNEIFVSGVKFSGENFTVGLGLYSDDKSAMEVHYFSGVLTTVEEDSKLKIDEFKLNDEAEFWKGIKEMIAWKEEHSNHTK
ncbi:MAG: hypothetical protein E7277_02070 [Lachnospiraceae bacterium]|jgi:hypothetical protein|nr:hypothetical protein [Lachnospiraceae bacterium]